MRRLVRSKWGWAPALPLMLVLAAVAAGTAQPSGTPVPAPTPVNSRSTAVDTSAVPTSPLPANKEKEVTLTVHGHGEVMDLIRDRLHLTTADVPAFPQPADLPNLEQQLREPQHWPETLTLNGVKLERRIHAWQGPIGATLRSMTQRKKHTRLVLAYDRAGAGVSAGWGPRYSWDEKDHLTERIWYEPDPDRLVTHDYTYYKDGRLLGYSWRSGPRAADNDTTETEFLSEFYDRSGKLIAIGYERRLGQANIAHYVWNGQPVPFDDFRMKSHSLYANSR